MDLVHSPLQRHEIFEKGHGEMGTGIVASVRDKGFGFIAPDGAPGGGDLFFHSSALQGTSFEAIQEGQRVSFDQEPDPRDASRQRAVNVRAIEARDAD
jgi:CspA family cold shock protein